jgi:hypothetical protein
MKSVVLTAAAALLAGTTLAAAQGNAPGNTGGSMGNHTQGASPAPAAQQHAPADKMAPAGAAQNHAPAQTTGQADKSPMPTTGQADKNKAEKGNADMKAKSGTTNAADKNGAAGKANEKSSMDSKANDKNGRSAAENNGGQKNTTTGQGAAASHGKANLTTEQRTKIRTVIKEKVHVQPLTHVNFSINVGTTVPRSVHVYPVPAEVVEIYPEWRGYNFVLVNDQIVIIDPATFTIVEVIA